MQTRYLLLLAFLLDVVTSQRIPEEKIPIDKPKGKGKDAGYEMFAGVLDPIDDPDSKRKNGDYPIMRPAWWVRMYKGPNCTDAFSPAEGSWANFGCSRQCFGVGPTRSVLLHARFWKTLPPGDPMVKERFSAALHWKETMRNVASQGPVVFAYANDCTQDQYLAKVVLKHYKKPVCHTFDDDRPAYRFHLRLQRFCDRAAEFGDPPPAHANFDFLHGKDGDAVRGTLERAPERVADVALKHGALEGDLEIVWDDEK